MGISSSISRRRRQGRERSPILKRRPGVGWALGYPGRKRRSGSLIFAPAKPSWPGCSTRISFWRPFVIGNLALGNVKNRDAVLTALLDLPAAILASDAKVLNFIDRRALFGRGVGYVDAHLLIDRGSETLDARQGPHRVAEDLRLAAAPKVGPPCPVGERGRR